MVGEVRMHAGAGEDPDAAGERLGGMARRLEGLPRALEQVPVLWVGNPRVHGAPPKESRVEPLHIVHARRARHVVRMRALRVFNAASPQRLVVDVDDRFDPAEHVVPERLRRVGTGHTAGQADDREVDVADFWRGFVTHEALRETLSDGSKLRTRLVVPPAAYVVFLGLLGASAWRTALLSFAVTAVT